MRRKEGSSRGTKLKMMGSGKMASRGPVKRSGGRMRGKTGMRK